MKKLEYAPRFFALSGNVSACNVLSLVLETVDVTATHCTFDEKNES